MVWRNLTLGFYGLKLEGTGTLSPLSGTGRAQLINSSCFRGTSLPILNLHGTNILPLLVHSSFWLTTRFHKVYLLLRPKWKAFSYTKFPVSVS